MTLLEQIDTLREEAAQLAAKSNEAGLAHVREVLRSDLREKENRIDELLLKYTALPHCPFPPCTGRLERLPQGPVGTLRCVTCLAMALPGTAVMRFVTVEPCIIKSENDNG